MANHFNDKTSTYTKIQRKRKKKNKPGAPFTWYIYKNFASSSKMKGKIMSKIQCLPYTR